MGYNRSYKGYPSREAADAAAIGDIKEYCSEAMWETLLFEAGRAAERGTAEACKDMNIAMSFCGISGYPFHAFGRKYFLKAYRAWMHEDDAYVTDEQGFEIKPVVIEG